MGLSLSGIVSLSKNININLSLVLIQPRCLSGIVSLSKNININLSLVLIQPRKTPPFITDDMILRELLFSIHTYKTVSRK